MQFLSHSTQETEAIGEELAQKLRGGDVLAFTGSLGMGKTAFTRQIPSGAPGGTTGKPEVCPSRSSRTSQGGFRIS